MSPAVGQPSWIGTVSGVDVASVDVPVPPKQGELMPPFTVIVVPVAPLVMVSVRVLNSTPT
jgi:hypothetical protein